MLNGRVITGSNHFQGVVMNTNLVNNANAQMGAKVGQEIGDKIAARLRGYANTSANAEPVKFKDGTRLASDLTPQEARALGDNLPLVGEYVNDIGKFRSLGITFESFAEDHLLNGPGEKIPVSAELFSAIAKQSREFSNTPLRIT